MIPYEFLADTISIGRYIKQFIERGFIVYFKTRPDELIKDQVDAYYLGSLREKVQIVETITPELMAEVDIVAGTQTSLLFDLLPFNKPLWVLETSFKFMYDIVEDGFARLLKEKDMGNIDDIYQVEMERKQIVNLEYFYGAKSIQVAVEEYLHRAQG